MRFDAATISELGPRSINEDEASWWSPCRGGLIAAIADGLGGMGGGGDASQIAIKTLRRHFADRLGDAPDFKLAAEAAHHEILAAQQSAPELRRMATTLTAAAFSQQGLVGVHCGDSRASIARGQGILRLTTDHSEGQRLFRAGKLSKQELLHYPRKNILDSALGVHEEPRIETFAFDLLPGDKVFLTTDGVHEKVLLREIREIAEGYDRPDDFVKRVAETVLLRGAEDNFSMIAVFVR